MGDSVRQATLGIVHFDIGRARSPTVGYCDSPVRIT
jgi:hypothetical protein